MTLAETVLKQTQDTVVDGEGFTLILTDGSSLTFLIDEEGHITARSGVWKFIPQGENYGLL